MAKKTSKKALRTKVGDSLLVQISATVPKSKGNVVVDIRRSGGGGGSLRSARASVSFDDDVKHNSVHMPLRDNEEFKIYLEVDKGVPPPAISVRYLGN